MIIFHWKSHNIQHEETRGKSQNGGVHTYKERSAAVRGTDLAVITVVVIVVAGRIQVGHSSGVKSRSFTRSFAFLQNFS